MTGESRQVVCKACEEADKSAKDAWECIKRAHKKKDKYGFEERLIISLFGFRRSCLSLWPGRRM
jgi:beta-galactosidase/beta-glucuronidase